MMVAQCSQSLRHLGHELRDKEVQVQLTSSPPARPCPPQHWAPAPCSCAPSWPQWGSNQSPAPSADVTLQIFVKKTWSETSSTQLKQSSVKINFGFVSVPVCRSFIPPFHFHSPPFAILPLPILSYSPPLRVFSAGLIPYKGGVSPER